MRYDKYIPNLPSHSPCGKQFNTTHAMDCKNGGCCNRAKIASCQFKLRSTNIEDDSRLNVKARGFNRQGQVAFFDIRIAHLNAESNNSQPTEKVLLRHEREKKERI